MPGKQRVSNMEHNQSTKVSQGDAGLLAVYIEFQPIIDGKERQSTEMHSDF
jgi:hypothetical protein